MDKIKDLFDFQHSVPFTDLHFKSDPKTGLQAIVAIHSTKLGPAFGGCRFIEYPDTDSAIIDALRLARGMSYKAAISGLAYGGGKSVIIKPKRVFDRKALFEAFGRFVEQLGGRYITAKDSGTILEDMDIIASQTSYVGSTSSMSDPSPFTAHGVRRGIEAAVKFRLGKDHLDGITVAIQGLGYVGHYLAKELHELGAKLIVCDINPQATAACEKEFGAQVVSTEEIYQVDCDVFSPCALGAVINDVTIPQLKATIIAGAANNQLAESSHGEELTKRGILYAPDYVINAGGLIQATTKYEHGSDEAVKQKIHNLYNELLGIFERATKLHLPTSVVADHIAEERL
jgi:leucine dehydrogenase